MIFAGIARHTGHPPPGKSALDAISKAASKFILSPAAPEATTFVREAWVVQMHLWQAANRPHDKVLDIRPLNCRGTPLGLWEFDGSWLGYLFGIFTNSEFNTEFTEE
jgi:hypothetical protein